VLAGAVTSSGQDALFFEGLRASGPVPNGGESSDLYDGLIGDWDAEVIDHLPGGVDRRQSAEMHFAWVLEGRAVQDLWISPARKDRKPSGWRAGDGNRYGTTLRVYDPAIGAWRMTWTNPVNGVENRLVGRRVGSQIVQTGSDGDGNLVRWVFVELTRDRFHWRGEVSADGGLTWTCVTEYFARRHGTPPGPRSDASDGIVERRVAWARNDQPSLETMRLVRGGEGNRAEGAILGVADGVSISTRYSIEHDAAWRFRQARIETEVNGVTRAVSLRRDENGQWSIDGTRRADLDGCEDFDLATTPYTNTPPLQSHALAPGQSRKLRVAWVQVPGLDVRAVEQEYSRLIANGSDGSVARYCYRNLDGGFTAELSVDADGLVIDYGPWVRR